MNRARKGSNDHEHRAALRQCWADLKRPEIRAFEDTDLLRGLRERHTSALAALVASGELDGVVADEIDAAFAQAIAHIQQQMTLCYIMVPAEYFPRDDLMRQAIVLEEMAVASEIDPATVAQARAALERDIAWLAKFHSGGTTGALGQVPVGAASVSAARTLIALLLSDQNL